MKKSLLLFFLLFLCCQAAFSQKIRRILLFAADSSQVDLRQQQAWLRADSAGLVQRDLFIAAFTSPRSQRAIFERFEAQDSDFTLILIAADGEEKHRSEKPLPSEELFRLVDAAMLPQAQRRNEKRP